MLLLMLILLLLLAACSGDDHPDPGLVQAPGFVDEAGRLTRPWRFIHHASNDSYRLTVSDGVARIERVGHEPWARLAQEIDREAAAAVAGRRMVFSADLRARLDDRVYGKPIEPSGLMVRVWREPAGGNNPMRAMVAAPKSRIERSPLAADAHIPDWQRHSIEFDVHANVSRIEVSVILATGGRLEIRAPSLRLIEG